MHVRINQHNVSQHPFSYGPMDAHKRNAAAKQHTFRGGMTLLFLWMCINQLYEPLIRAAPLRFKFSGPFLGGKTPPAQKSSVWETDVRVVRAMPPPEVRRAYIICDSCRCVLLPMNHPLRISQQAANFGTHGHPYTRGFPRLNGQPTLSVPRRHI